MIVIRYRVIRSTRLGNPQEPYVVVRVELHNGVPEDISVAAGPFDDLSDGWAAVHKLSRMGG